MQYRPHTNKRNSHAMLGWGLIVLWFSCGQVDTGFAEIRLPHVLSDHMVLQQKTSVPIWGWATPGEPIRVAASWQVMAVSTRADDSGYWMVRIDTPQAGGPFEIEIAATNTVRLTDVLVGEVWFASGQSNMGMPVAKRPTWKHGILNWEEEVANANHPNIRLFHVRKRAADRAQADTDGEWLACDPDSVREFSAVAYFFGRMLHRELDVPVGLFDASFGGSRAAAWMTPKWLRSDPDFQPILQRFDEAVDHYPAAIAKYNQDRAEWQQQVERAEKTGVRPPRPPRRPLGPGHPHSPTALYNGMVTPILPYGIRGVIWYQGESNRERAFQYRKLCPALIRNWRDDWGQGQFPFYFVQIGPFPYRQEPLAAAELREAQRLALSVPHTGMVVTTDIANPADLHPQNKQDVGRRLALWALAGDYGRSEIEYSGPLYRRMEIAGNRIRVYFDHVGGGLVAGGNEPLSHFTIAGDDQSFHEAEAMIEGETVIVQSPKVDAPTAVRFGWSNDAVPNLFNRAGLPASPFATDDWPGVTHAAR